MSQAGGGQLAACTGWGRESFRERMGKPKVSKKERLSRLWPVSDRKDKNMEKGKVRLF